MLIPFHLPFGCPLARIMVDRIRKYFSNKSFFNHKASLKAEDGDENFNELTMGANNIRYVSPCYSSKLYYYLNAILTV